MAQGSERGSAFDDVMAVSDSGDTGMIVHIEEQETEIELLFWSPNVETIVARLDQFGRPLDRRPTNSPVFGVTD